MERARPQASLLVRRIRIVLLLLAIGAASLWVIIWMQEADLRKARQLLQEDRPVEAMESIQAWEQEHGPTSVSTALKSQCLVDLGRYEQAIELFQIVGAETTEELHDWARAYLHQEQWTQAIPLLENLAKRLPDDPDVLHELTSCRAKLGQIDAALESAQRFAQNPQFAQRAWLMIGILERDRGNQSQALAAFQQVLKHDPELSNLQIPAEDFLTQFASLHLEAGNLAEAARPLERALERTPTAETHFQAGLLAELQGDPENAIKHWRIALGLSSQHLNARESLARLLIGSGNLEEAKRLLKPLLQEAVPRSSTTYLMQQISTIEGDNSSAEHWRLKTEQLRKREQLDSAVNQLLKESPNSFWAKVVRIYQFAEQGNYEQVKTLLESLPQSNEEHQFVIDLRNAIEQRRPLPPKEQLPITLL